MVACGCRLELRRGASVSLSGMERNILLTYFGWELVNLFLGGVLSASLVRCDILAGYLLDCFVSYSSYWRATLSRCCSQTLGQLSLLPAISATVGDGMISF